MLQYANTVRKLAGKGGNWRLFDTTFRQLKVRNEKLRWEHTEWELWSDCLDKNSSPKFTMGSGFSSEVCFNFQEGKTCRPFCKYMHICSRCGGRHDLINCFSILAAPQSFLSVRPQRPRYQNPHTFQLTSTITNYGQQHRFQRPHIQDAVRNTRPIRPPTPHNPNFRPQRTTYQSAFTRKYYNPN